MKNKILVLIFLLTAFTVNAQWSIDSGNTAGIYPYSGGTTNKAVFANGTQWNVFDAINNTHTWGTFSQSRLQIQTVSIGDKVYFGGGKFGSFADPLYTNNVNVYNGISNTWSTLLLSKKRQVGGAAATGNTIIFGGGIGRQDISGPVYMYKTADIFDITTGTRTTGNLSKARSNIAAGATGNKIVFAGGWYWDFNYNVLPANNVDIYDITTGIWTTKTLSKKRENISVAVVGSKIIFAGGTGGTFGGAVTDVDIYDASTDTWITTNLPTARYGMKSVVIGSKAYFAGGSNDPTLNEVDIYDANSNSWSTIYIPVSLSGFSMSVINSKIYFAGGYNGSAYYDLVQIYEPSTDIWTTDHLSIARYAVAAVTCINKGYFAGGYIAYAYPTPVGTNRVDILSLASPIADFTANATVITVGDMVNFSDLSTNSPTSWFWTFNEGTPSTSIEKDPSNIQYTTAGIYNVTMTATNSLGSNTVTKVGYITVNAALCLAPAGLNTIDITSTSATLNWNLVSNATKYKVSWKTGNNPWTTTTVTTNSKVIPGLTPGTLYAWKVKSICGQGISSVFSPNQQFTTIAGKMGSTIMKPDIVVYPNPFNISATVSISTTQDARVLVELYDMTGKKLQKMFEGNVGAGVQVVNLNRDQLKEGVYFIKLSMNNEVIVKKVIIE